MAASKVTDLTDQGGTVRLDQIINHTVRDELTSR
jgi:hypothetical protein